MKTTEDVGGKTKNNPCSQSIAVAMPKDDNVKAKFIAASLFFVFLRMTPQRR
jgi:hypothetical protein